MPGDHISGMLSRAKLALGQWLAEHDRLCDFKRSDFVQPYPYDEQHMQALYILRYYPAYFAENYLLFESLLEDGLVNPIVESIGCGCLVDLAAAKFVYDAIVPYTGYDINDWNIKAAELDNEIVEFRRGDVLTADRFYPNSNVFIFSRSIGDLSGILRQIRAKAQETSYTADTIYVCATYRASSYNIDRDMRNLRLFASSFQNYQQSENILYYPAGQNPPVYSGINTRCRWFNHHEADYCQGLLDHCVKPTSTCPELQCQRWVSAAPILRLNHLAFEILKLRRV